MVAKSRNRHNVFPEQEPITSAVSDDHAPAPPSSIVAFAGMPAKPSANARAALAVIGAWRDMDWDQLADDLDRLRHESAPTSSIDLHDL